MKFRFKSLVISGIFAVLLSSCSHQSVTETEVAVSKIERAPASVDIQNVPVEAPPPVFSFDWPVDKARFSRGFLPNKRRPHLGIDLAANRGTPILSAHKGVVIYAGRDFKGFGKMILIEYGGNWATLYAHLDKILVSEGQKVIQGGVIGTMGRTGRATGTHLHFEIRKDKDPVDPLLYLPRVRKIADISE